MTDRPLEQLPRAQEVALPAEGLEMRTYRRIEFLLTGALLMALGACGDLETDLNGAERGASSAVSCPANFSIAYLLEKARLYSKATTESSLKRAYLPKYTPLCIYKQTIIKDTSQTPTGDNWYLVKLSDQKTEGYIKQDLIQEGQPPERIGRSSSCGNYGIPGE